MIEKIEEKIRREGNFIFIDRIGYLRTRDISEIIIHDEGSVSIEMRENVHHITPGKGITISWSNMHCNIAPEASTCGETTTTG